MEKLTGNAGLGKVIAIDEAKVEAHLGELVRGSVEATLNSLLDAEAERLCNARRYERTEGRRDTRAGHYERSLHTKAGPVQRQVPKLRHLPLSDGDHRALPPAGELGGGSVGRDVPRGGLGPAGGGHHGGVVGDAGQSLHRERAEPEDLCARIEAWRNRPIEGEHPYVYLDGVYLKRSWGGQVRNVAVLVAIGVDAEGFRDVLGVCEGAKEDQTSWEGFLRHLKQRGLRGVRLVISDKCLGLIEALGQVYPEASWQQCIVHFYRNVFSVMPKGKVKEVAAMLKAIHAQEDRAEAQAKVAAVVAKLRAMKLGKAAERLAEGGDETLTYYGFPREHWRRIRTNNPLERMMREIRRRTRAVGAFPDGQSTLMLAAARLRHVTGTRWGTRRYLDMEHFKTLEETR